MKLTIVIVYYNTPKEILNCINSIPPALKGINYEVMIVNNASPKPLPSALEKRPKINIINSSENLGYGKAINRASRHSKGEYILILNPDTICTKNSIKLMIGKIKKMKRIGVLGPQQISKKGEILNSTAGLPKLPDALFALSFINKIWPHNPYSKRYWGIGLDRTKEQETDTVGGACMLFPKKVFDKIGGFDERFFMYFEEADICWRIKKAGYKVLYYPEAKIIHLVGKSTSDKKWIRRIYEQSRFKFFQKYYGTPLALLSETFLSHSIPTHCKSEKN